MTPLSDQQATRQQVEITTESTPPSLVGTVLDDRYEILSLLGKGGMSVVYRARQILMDKDVAVKMLLKGSASVESMHRFQHEAKAISHLEHDNIIKVHSFVLSEAGIYLVIDYLEGTSLDEVLHEEKRLPIERALPIFKQAASALEHAHSRGIIHRDLKPSNLMLQHNNPYNAETVKLVDFGIAKLVPHEGEKVQELTRAGAVFGTPAYMSPEQCTGKPLDVRSDIYSLGCVMFETLAGDPPLEGDSAMTTMYMQLRDKPPLLGEALPGQEVPLDMEKIIDRCLKKDPAERYQSMTELRSALEAIEFGSTTVIRSSEALPKQVSHHRKIHPKYFVTGAIIGVAISMAGLAYTQRDAIEAFRMEVESQNPNTSAAKRISLETQIAQFYEKQKNYPKATSHYDRVVELAVASKSPRAILAAHILFANYLDRTGKAEVSSEDLEALGVGIELIEGHSVDQSELAELLKISKRASVNVPREAFPLICKLGLNALNEHLLPAAQSFLTLALSINGAPREETQVIEFHLGRVLFERGEFTEAATTWNHLIQALERPTEKASLLIQIGDEAANHSSPEIARGYYLQALKISQELRLVEQQAVLQKKLGDCLAASSAPAQALKYYESAARTLRDNGAVNSHAYLGALQGIGQSQLALKQYVPATKSFEEALSLAERLNISEPNQIAPTFLSLADAQRLQKKYDNAQSTLMRATQFLKRYPLEKVRSVTYLQIEAALRQLQAQRRHPSP